MLGFGTTGSSDHLSIRLEVNTMITLSLWQIFILVCFLNVNVL